MGDDGAAPVSPDLLAEVAHGAHRRALEREMAALRADAEVAAVLLQGSVARGDAHPGSDLDLLVVLREGSPCAFRHAVVDGVRVEQHRATPECFRERLARQPGIAHGVLDARVVFDRDGIAPAVFALARRALDGWRLDDGERRRLAYWLRTAAEKVGAAADAGDWRRAALVASATAWQLVEGLWAMNHLPPPPAGAVLARLPSLARVPPGTEAALDRLLLGTPPERAAAFRELAVAVADALE